MEKELKKYFADLTDEEILRMYKHQHDEVNVVRKPNGSIFISWLNDNGFRQTGGGLIQVYNTKTELVNQRFLQKFRTPNP